MGVGALLHAQGLMDCSMWGQQYMRASLLVGWLIERLKSSVIICNAQQLHMPGRSAVPAVAQRELLSTTQVARLGSFGPRLLQCGVASSRQLIAAGAPCVVWRSCHALQAILSDRCCLMKAPSLSCLQLGPGCGARSLAFSLTLLSRGAPHAVSRPTRYWPACLGRQVVIGPWCRVCVESMLCKSRTCVAAASGCLCVCNRYEVTQPVWCTGLLHGWLDSMYIPCSCALAAERVDLQ